MFSKRVRKTIAAFFLLLMVQSAVVPCVSYALTAGPTAPEATSFEPVDTTDLVDLKTGDFTYNIPVLEIPGPAGGYPLSLSYHAGIQPDQEASWVGLGWSLNPGSISRLVNGYPDDHYNVTSVDRSYWKGGNRETYIVGGSVGIANGVNVSGGLSFAQDTYRGFGVGGYVGFGVYSDYGNARLGLSVEMGMNPFGDNYTQVGAQLGNRGTEEKVWNLTGSIGLSANSNSGITGSASGGISYGQTSVLDASISTSSSKVSLTALGGTTGVYNKRKDNVSINSDHFVVDIPIIYAVSARLGRDYVRYWIDETQSVHTFGSLYLNQAQSGFETAFDSYDILDTSIDFAVHDNGEKVLGGSFPDHDLFNVTGQGISGSIRPYHFQQHLQRQDKRVGDNGKILIKNYPLNNTPTKPVQFRFSNDFSNRFEYSPADFSLANDQVTFNFDDSFLTGENGAEGYSAERNHLAGSKHVEWYSNKDILLSDPNKNPFSEGFVDCVAQGFVREGDHQIGGFSITNTSGVTYHYALPAYSFDEYMKTVNSETKQDQNGERFNELTKPEKYAYTWYLTSVTGPDFVDRNENGIADHGDWGYWVSFQYSKWLEDYKWRNPGEGTNRDIDGDFEFFSAGKKEIYYLDKVVTDSHVAIFEKSQRKDGREVADLKEGGFVPDGGSSNGLPRATLRLDKIKLFTYESFNSGHTSEENVLRAISFNYDYSLAPDTPNSFDSDFIKLGKLTLGSLLFLGKKNISLTPPMVFEYNNAPYEKDKVDIWGFYKKDYDQQYRDDTNDVIGRQTTELSSQFVDAWSLSKITAPLGAEILIDYESDIYEDVAMARAQFLRVKDVTDHSANKLKLNFWEIVDLSQYFHVGQQIDLDLIGSYDGYEYTSKQCNCDELIIKMYHPLSFTGAVHIDQINVAEGYIVVSNTQLYNKLKYETKVIQNYWGSIGVCSDDVDIVKCDYTYSGVNAWPDYFPAGTVSTEESEKPGGGLRVKSIKLKNLLDDEGSITEYIYDGGTTSYEPFVILPPKIHPAYAALQNTTAGTRLNFKRNVLNKFYKQIGISRSLPGPGVIYKNVTVREKSVTADGVVHDRENFAKYEFEVYQQGLVDVVRSQVREEDIQGNYDNVAFNKAVLNQVTVKDFSSRIGNLKSVTFYNTSDQTPLSKTTNHFLHDGLDGSFEQNVSEYEPDLAQRFNNQGLIEETYTRSRIAYFDLLDAKPYHVNSPIDYFEHEERNLLATINKLETFPSIPTGQTNVNFKTGISSSSENISFDFYSGEFTSVLTKDSYGNRYLSEIIPAYRKYPGMGLKTTDVKNKHMLSQLTMENSFVVDEGLVKQGLLSASVQTWSNSIAILNETVSGNPTSIWRKKNNYVWSGQHDLNTDGSQYLPDFVNRPFSWNATDVDTFWEKTSEITLYDINSHAIEAKDINNNFLSSRMDNQQHRVIASASNSAYHEMAYSGAEYYSGNSNSEGGTNRGSGAPSSAFAHTGKYGLLVGSGLKGFNYTLKAKVDEGSLKRKYHASVWVYAPGYSETQAGLDKIQLYYVINGVEKEVHPKLQKNKSKNWYLLNIDIDPMFSSEVFVGVRNSSQRGVYFDDFRVHPIDASLSSYVYDDMTGELTHILDNNNFYVKFEYDAMGRLVRTSKELLNFDFGNGKESFRADAILKEVKYNYGKK